MSSPSAAARPEAVDAARRSEARPRRSRRAASFAFVEELARGRADSGSSRICGNLPLQLPGVEEELPVDVLAQHGERRLDQARAREGAARAGPPRASRSASGSARAASSAAAAACASCSACSSRSRSCSSRLSRVERRAPVGSSRSETTPTTREASSTCRVGWPYAGAILHRRVLAARWSRRRSGAAGRARAAPSPSATCTISSSDGVIRPERPTMSQPSSTRGVEDPVGRTMTPRSITS